MSADAGGINDTVCQISSVPVCQSVGDIIQMLPSNIQLQ